MGEFMEVNFKDIEKYIDSSKIKYDEPMKKYTTLKVGGKADVLVLPEEIQDVKQVLNYAKQNNIPVTVIGNGSKLLVKDDGIRGIVIKFGSKFANIDIDGEYVTVQAGMTLPRLAIIARENSLSGLEFSSGIPGNIGGAVYMNAGAYGSEMSNVIVEVTYIDENLEINTIDNNECKFEYRNSIFRKTNNVILSTKLKLVKADKDEIAEKMKQNQESRKSKQPLEYPNAGSTFKRPEGYFVGKLIDDLGLKGYSIGGAQISTKHSGFIINTGEATAKDVLQLIDYIKAKVLQANNVKLEEEIIILGEGE